MKEILQKAFSLLNASQKKRGLMIIGLLVFQSLLDFFSIASFLPLVFLIINPGFIISNKILASAYTYFSFSSSTNFIIAIAVLVLVFTIIKAVIGYGINRVKARFAFGVGAELSGRAMEYYLASGYLRFSEADFSREVTRINSHPITFAN